MNVRESPGSPDPVLTGPGSKIGCTNGPRNLPSRLIDSNQPTAKTSVRALKEFFEQGMTEKDSEPHAKHKPIYRRVTESNLCVYFTHPHAEKEGETLESDCECVFEIVENDPEPVEELPLEESGHISKPALRLNLAFVKEAEERRKGKGKDRVESRKGIHEITPQKRFMIERSASTHSLLGSRVPPRGRLDNPLRASNADIPLLSIISPRNGIKRDYLRSSIAPEKMSESMDLSSLTEIKGSEKEKKSFDKKTLRFINTGWKGTEKPSLSAISIEKIVEKLCRTEIDELFKNERDIRVSELEITESPRSKELLYIVQKSGVLLVPIIQRLKVMQKSLVNYLSLKGEKTPWTEKLAGVLDDLISPDIYEGEEIEHGLEKGKDLNRFLHLIEGLKKGKKDDRRIAELIMKAFGDKGKIRKEVMATLQKWNNPPKKLMSKFKKQVHKFSWDNVGATNIPFVEHEWFEASSALHPIRKIEVGEVIRCFATENAVIMNTITINGRTFYEVKKGEECSEGEENSGEYSQRDFLKRLIQAVYQAGLDPDIEEREIEEQLDRMFALKSAKEKSEEFKSLDLFPIPCLNLLRLCTMSAWGHGDAYLRKLFPGLFRPPYWTKLLQGIQCHITITSPASFSVTLVKNYGVFPRLRPHDLESTAVDRTRLLATFPVSWTLSTLEDTWKGVLNIPEEIDIKPCASPEEKWDILRSIIKFQDLESPKNLRSPDTPRMRSSPRTTLTRKEFQERLQRPRLLKVEVSGS